MGIILPGAELVNRVFGTRDFHGHVPVVRKMAVRMESIIGEDRPVRGHAHGAVVVRGL